MMMMMIIKRLYPSEFAKTCPLGFRLDSGFARIQAKPAALNPEGAPSRLGWAHGPMTGLSAGGLLEASCQKQGGGEGVFH